MSVKTCVYHNCSNKSSTSPQIFFGFPLKDEKKCKLWAERAGFTLTPQRTHYLCDVHFPPIYKSKTTRRTILLPTAMPYHYDKQGQTENIDTKPISGDISATDDFSECEYLSEEPADDPLEVVGRLNETSTVAAKTVKLPAGLRLISMGGLKKVKIQQNLTCIEKPITPSDQVTYSELKVQPTKRKLSVTNGNDTNTQEAHVVDNISVTPETSTFQFRGEEMVQMPKRIYLEQRSQLIDEIVKYKSIVDKMRQILAPSSL